MGKLKNGPHGPVTGKLGNTTAYMLNGQNVVRTKSAGKKVKQSNLSKSQIDTQLVNKLLSPVNKFIEFGYAFEVKKNKTLNAHNIASREVRHAIVGRHPDQYFDYSKILFASGRLPLPKDINVDLVDRELKFTWDTSVDDEDGSYTDLVMVLAYYPEVFQADFIRSGSRRSIGSEFLPMFAHKKDQVVEIYIAFISDDHKKVSNSLYLGQIVWEGRKK